MGYHGNAADNVAGDQVITLNNVKRTDTPNTIESNPLAGVKKKDPFMNYQPHLMATANGGLISSIRGRGDTKPSKKGDRDYQRAIAMLLAHGKLHDPRSETENKTTPIRGLMSKSGDDIEKNFHFEDLDPEYQAYVEKHNPDFVAQMFHPKIINHTSSKHIPEIVRHNNFVRSGIHEKLGIPFSQLSTQIPKMIQSDKITPEMMDTIVDNINVFSPSAYKAILSSPVVTEKHLRTVLVKNADPKVQAAVFQAPAITPELLDLATRNANPEVIQAAMKSPKFGLKMHDTFMRSKNPIVREQAIKYSRHLQPVDDVTPPSIKPAMRDVDPIEIGSREGMAFEGLNRPQQTRDLPAAFQQQRVGRNPSSEVAVRLADQDDRVKIAAAKSPALGKSFTRAIAHSMPEVRAAAVENPLFTPEHFKQFQGNSDEDYRVHAALVKSPHFKPEHGEWAKNHKDENVRAAYARSPAFNPEHLGDMLKDKHGDVILAALHSPHLSHDHLSQMNPNAVPPEHSRIIEHAMNFHKERLGAPPPTPPSPDEPF